ncbi:MAG: sodium/glutamate symporter, partial [Pseudomonadota bacterium]
MVDSFGRGAFEISTHSSGAEELGIAVATFGLVAAALIGGPIARYL